VVELILKYRAKWEDLYWSQLATYRRVHFQLKGTNYLTQMASEVQQLVSAEVSDPFLIATTARLRRALEQPNNPELTLRLRACELLLIEEDLLV
jgi:hypothetical protein